MGPHRANHLVTNLKGSGLLLMLKPENCEQENPGNVENQVVPLGAQT